MAVIVQTQRTVARSVELTDADFFNALLNTPGWKRFIGDSGVDDHRSAEVYVREKMLKTYERHRFGYYTVALRNGTPIGICGFLKKPHLENPDFGFAYLPEFHRQGYGFEAGRAIFDFGVNEFGFQVIDAETRRENEASGRLLSKLNFREIEAVEDSDEKRGIQVYRWMTGS
ncbi:MAG: GNAT family N-acetyltransferase [Limisphaerales bacterium]